MKKQDNLQKQLVTRGRESTWGHMFRHLPDPDTLLAQSGISIEDIRQLSFDSHVFAAIQQRVTGITSLRWQVKKKYADGEPSRFITEILEQLDLDRLIPQILDAVFLGYSVMEIVWKREDGKMVPCSVEQKPQEWFYFDEKNQLRYTEDSRSDGFVLPEYKFLLAQNQASYNNPYGEKVLSRCYWPVQFKKNGYKFWVTFVERYGMPFLAARQPKGYSQADTQKLLEALEKMMQDTYGVLPDDSSVEFIQGSANANSEVYTRFLNFCNTEISKSILSQTLTTEVQERGTYAAAKTHQNMLHHILLGDKRLVERTVNCLIRMIWELNFGSSQMDALPVFEMFSEDDSNKVLAERDRLLRKQGVLFTKDYYCRTYNLRADDFDLRKAAEVAAK